MQLEFAYQAIFSGIAEAIEAGESERKLLSSRSGSFRHKKFDHRYAGTVVGLFYLDVVHQTPN